MTEGEKEKIVRRKQDGKLLRMVGESGGDICVEEEFAFAHPPYLRTLKLWHRADLYEVDTQPCPRCGNTFIQLYGRDDLGWWVGCKPCSKVEPDGPEIMHRATRADAVRDWNKYCEEHKS